MDKQAIINKARHRQLLLDERESLEQERAALESNITTYTLSIEAATKELQALLPPGEYVEIDGWEYYRDYAGFSIKRVHRLT